MPYLDPASVTLRQRKHYQNLELESISQVAHSLMEAATYCNYEFTSASNFEQVQLMFEVSESLLTNFKIEKLYFCILIWLNCCSPSSLAYLVSLFGSLQHWPPILRRSEHLGSLSARLLRGNSRGLPVPTWHPAEGICSDAYQIHASDRQQFPFRYSAQECRVYKTTHSHRSWERQLFGCMLYALMGNGWGVNIADYKRNDAKAWDREPSSPPPPLPHLENFFFQIFCDLSYN